MYVIVLPIVLHGYAQEKLTSSSWRAPIHYVHVGWVWFGFIFLLHVLHVSIL